MRTLASQFARFGVVGAVGFVIDFGVFNLLTNTFLGSETVHEGPLLAKVISTTLAIIFNWMGNRHWTFRAHRGRQLMREGVEFGVVSVGGMLIGLACLFVSHYVLGFDSKLADNISSNVIGLGLGTLFRFTLYRLWVFAPHRGEPEPALFPEVGTGSVPTVSPTTSSRRGSRAPAGGTAPAAVAPQSD
ncbi:MAG TPA: GtrA family protein [Pseudolysinimonas sp.]|jgi:putative flippase GtrA|nr:GtrA family protein [Pseudolysinimonas sp.]